MNEVAPKINIKYQGNLADRLVWNSLALEQFTAAARLKTSVIVKEGDANIGSDTECLGDTLVWKVVGSPSNFFSISPKSRNPVPFVEVSYPEKGQSIVAINHKVITDSVLKVSKAEFEEGRFVETVDTSVKAGLGLILAREKRDLTANAMEKHTAIAFNNTVRGALTIFETGYTAGFAYVSYMLLNAEGSHYLQQLGMLQTPSSYILARVLEGGLSFCFAIESLVLALMTFRHAQTSSLEKLYENSLKPTDGAFSHVRDFMKGHHFLTNSRLRMVTLLADQKKD